MFEVKVKQVPAQRYAARTANVRVAQLEPFILETIGELSTEAVAGPPFTIFHGAVTEESDGPVEVGVPRTDGDLELPAGEVAYTTISGTQCDFPRSSAPTTRLGVGCRRTSGRWPARRARSI